MREIIRIKETLKNSVFMCFFFVSLALDSSTFLNKYCRRRHHHIYTSLNLAQWEKKQQRASSLFEIIVHTYPTSMKSVLSPKRKSRKKKKR